jgi:hypothetical protein
MDRAAFLCPQTLFAMHVVGQRASVAETCKTLVFKHCVVNIYNVSFTRLQKVQQQKIAPSAASD